MIKYREIAIYDDRLSVVGELYFSDNPRDLSQDMVDVTVPVDGGEIIISAGWYPEEDPTGSYQVLVVSGLEDVLSPFYTKEMEMAATYIENVAQRLLYDELLTESSSLTSDVDVELNPSMIGREDIGNHAQHRSNMYSLC